MPVHELPVKNFDSAHAPADSEAAEGNIVLNGFGNLVTARRAIEAFAAGNPRQAALDRIEADTQYTDPFKPEPLLYLGSIARTIYDSLSQAANRQTELLDADAAYLLHGVNGTPGGSPAALALPKSQSEQSFLPLPLAA